MTSLASCTKIARDNWSSSVARVFVTTHPWVSRLSLQGHLVDARLPGVQALGTWAPCPQAAPAPLLSGARRWDAAVKVMIHREDPWTVSDPVSQPPPVLGGIPSPTVP